MKTCKDPLDSALKEPEKSAGVILIHLGRVVVTFVLVSLTI